MPIILYFNDLIYRKVLKFLSAFVLHANTRFYCQFFQCILVVSNKSKKSCYTKNCCVWIQCFHRFDCDRYTLQNVCVCVCVLAGTCTNKRKFHLVNWFTQLTPTITLTVFFYKYFTLLLFDCVIIEIIL